ncbi:sensor histidine kinase [Streptomyces sp. NBC_01198]|uniref:sensor histidine kinase n=1 Tax=Streptomyces sp. NBC_01198 TaxID=2903769 RepID=UPI002E0E9171|nr:sensor domain-containing protein [Streptomyces sp. NBC_01198]
MRGERSVWQALARRGFLVSGWPWRAAGYLAGGVLTGALTLAALAAALLLGGALAVVVVGLPVLALAALGGIPVGAVERRRLRLVDAAPVPSPHRGPAEPGFGSWARARFRERATWRELGYAALLALVLWPLDALVLTVGVVVPAALLAAPVAMAVNGGETKVLKAWTVDGWPSAAVTALAGLPALAAGAYLVGVAAGTRAAAARGLLVPADADARITELTRSRVRLVDAFEAERRRIERDLHDGAQQRLVALTMTLGLARLDAPPGPLAEQLAKAHEQAGAALAELRRLIHGIHPQVLADYGLAAAVADAADRSPVPVDVDLDLPVRLPQAVEAAAYYVVCEALANVAKHSGATRARVSGGHRGGRLTLTVHDDGRGGAAAARGPDAHGSGLTGLADRVSVVSGTLALASPPGGPTRLRVEIPCEPTPTPPPQRAAPR